MSEEYLRMNLGMAHTFSRIPRVEFMAFVCGSSVWKNGQNARQASRTFGVLTAASAMDATAEIGVKIDTVASIDLKILSRC
jgi:hypothetical protein